VRLVLDPAVRLYGGGRVLVARGRIIRLAEGGPAALRALLADTATPAQRRLGERLIDAGFAHPRPARRRVDVTVVIPVRDHEVKGSGPLCVVVDDGSREPAVCEGATVIRRERPGGPAAARNEGIAHVETEFVAFLDSDCVPPDDWIERLAGHFDDPRVAAVAPRIRASDGGRSPLDLGPGRHVSYLPSAALIVRMAAQPWFDPALRYGEDVDLIWRLADAGWRFRYEPDVVVLHDERDRLKRRFWYGTSAAPLSRRHPGRLRHVVLRPWSVVTLALLARPKFALLLYAIQTARLARTLRRKGVPARLAPLWTARALVHTVTQFGRLTSPYGAGVVSGHLAARMRGLPTISGPSIHERTGHQAT
jgi:mycofactocin system glycosyltransferase